MANLQVGNKDVNEVWAGTKPVQEVWVGTDLVWQNEISDTINFGTGTSFKITYEAGAASGNREDKYYIAGIVDSDDSPNNKVLGNLSRVPAPPTTIYICNKARNLAAFTEYLIVIYPNGEVKFSGLTVSGTTTSYVNASNEIGTILKDIKIGCIDVETTVNANCKWEAPIGVTDVTTRYIGWNAVAEDSVQGPRGLIMKQPPKKPAGYFVKFKVVELGGDLDSAGSVSGYVTKNGEVCV